MADKGNGGAKTALRLLDDPSKLLSTVQIGITAIGVIAGAYAATSLSNDLTPVIAGLHPSVTGGTSPLAQTQGYSVGGKSGTAYKQEGKGYALHKYRSWFVGLAPIQNPRLVVAVMVDEPSDGKHFGGQVAAPVFSQVVQQSLRLMGVQPDLDVKPQIVAQQLNVAAGAVPMGVAMLTLLLSALVLLGNWRRRASGRADAGAVADAQGVAMPEQWRLLLAVGVWTLVYTAVLQAGVVRYGIVTVVYLLATFLMVSHAACERTFRGRSAWRWCSAWDWTTYFATCWWQTFPETLPWICCNPLPMC